MMHAEPTDNTAAFDAMSDRIKKNAPEDFAGAFVIVAPDGMQKSLLVLDNSQSPVTFWGLLLSTAQTALAEIDAHERLGGSPYGRQR